MDTPIWAVLPKRYFKMKWFVFRNNTVEPFFDGKTVAFSGYDDVSVVPTEAEGFILFGFIKCQ